MKFHQENWRRVRSKPVECMAFQFDPHGVHRLRLPDEVIGRPAPGADNWAYEGCQFTVNTVLGLQPVSPFDWIIRTDDGNCRVCRREAFEEGFERVEQP